MSSSDTRFLSVQPSIIKDSMYAVIFNSQRSDVDEEGYAVAAQRMEELAQTQPGFVRIHSVRDTNGKGITVSYWSSMEAVRQWAVNSEHLVAQRQGRQRWYQAYEIDVARVERHSELGVFSASV